MLGPIFQREFLTLPRRSNHYVARTVYLGVLWILSLTAWQVSVGWNQTATLGDQARFSLTLFKVLCVLQLTLLLFFSALTAASSITTEKDRRTFVLLLMTDLRNYEIVLGKLGGSLLQILLLLLGTIPILTFLLLLGGVTQEQVVQAIVVLAATVVVAGSLGTLVSLWRDKTFQALALTVLFMVLYVCLVRALVVLPAMTSGSNWYVNNDSIVAWQQWLEPFLALNTAIEPPMNQQYRIAPAYGYGLAMLLVAAVLNFISIWRLRAWNPRGEPRQQREKQTTEEEVDERERIDIHASPGKIRNVWANPILWREIATRAYGHRPLLVKLAYFLVIGLVCYYTIAPLFDDEAQSSWIAAYALVPVGILSMLLISAQAVTAITSEKDSGAINLLLVTDLTPQEFIFGKLWGIVWNTKEYLLPPLLLALYFGVSGYVAKPPLTVRNIEATLALTIGLLTLIVFTTVLGVYVALRTPLSRVAIANTLGTVFFLSVGTLLCIYLILINGRFEYQWFSFIFFLAAGIGGLWWVLCYERPSNALFLASVICPLAVFYTITNLLIGKPGTRESSDPLMPFLVMVGAFAFTVAAMMIPLLSEFDVAMGRTTGEAD